MKQTLMHRRTLVLFLATVIILAAIPFANASGVTCRSGFDCLNAHRHYDWTMNYGPPFSSIPNHSIATADNLLQATVNFAGGGNGERRDQGWMGGWNGNFTPGDELLWTNSPGQGPLTLTFSSPILGAGANIQSDAFGPFTALIQAFDARGRLIDSFSEQGDSNPNGDGSAIFIGLTNDSGIKSIEFSLTSCGFDCGDFAINQLDIITPGCAGLSCGPLPEPGSLLLMGSALFGVAGAARKSVRRSL